MLSAGRRPPRWPTFVAANALETDDPSLMPDRHGIRWSPPAADIGSPGGAALGGRGMPVSAYDSADGVLVRVDHGAIDEATLRSRVGGLFGVGA